MPRGIHPFASFTSPVPKVAGSAGVEHGAVVLRTNAFAPPLLLEPDAARLAAPLAFCRSTDAMMLALANGPVRLLLIDVGTPAIGTLDPAESLLPLLTSPYRDIPRVLLSHDPDGATGWWSQGSGWFRGTARTPLDGSTLASLLDAHAACQ